MKKTSESKKALEENEDASAASSSSSSTAKAASKDEDVYEFKTTPKDSSSSSGDDKSDGGKGSDKSSDEKGDDQGTKRSYSDVEGDADEDSKRKKRKDGETGAKEPKPGPSSGRLASQRQEKGAKAAGTSAKNPALANKAVTALDRKSPSGSPKPAPTKASDSDAEADDKGSGDGFGVAGPKVPPLKIVIPQQNTNTDQEIGTRNGKNISARGHAALPYVVASSSNSNDSADKESVSSRCTSPSDSTKSIDEKKTNTVMTNEEQRQQRVLRSSHRGGGQSVDRSNNSSPQLQSSSPSPAPATSTSNAATSTATSTATTTSTTTVAETIDTNPKPSTSSSSSSGNGGNSSGSPCNTVNNNESEAASNAPSPSASSTSSTKESQQNTVELHPRKRKIRASKDENKQMATATTSTQSNTSNDNTDNISTSDQPHPHDQPITNCVQMYVGIRKQICNRHLRLTKVQPKPPQGFADYLLNRKTYTLAPKIPTEPVITYPPNLPAQMKDLFTEQEKQRLTQKMEHIVEKEKLVLAVEQEILRVHGRAARALANQSLPYSACTILKDEEVYNIITPEQEEQEEKDRNARSRYNGRLFLSWLQDVDDKWEKIKVSVVVLTLLCFFSSNTYLLNKNKNNRISNFN